MTEAVLAVGARAYMWHARIHSQGMDFQPDV
jgi:hypothetical protein